MKTVGPVLTTGRGETVGPVLTTGRGETVGPALTTGRGETVGPALTARRGEESTHLPVFTRQRTEKWRERLSKEKLLWSSEME